MRSNRYPAPGWLGGRWGGALLVALAALGVSPPAARADPFTPGNLVVLSAATTGTAGTAAAVSLVEYQPAGGAAVQTINLPSSGGGTLLTQSNNNPLEGSLSRSDDGRFLTLVGYNAGVGAPVGAANTRVVGRVGADGTFDLSTTTTSLFSPSRIRSGATSDGSWFWVAGGTNTTGEIDTLPFGGSGAATNVDAGNNARVVHVVNGQLYGSTATGVFRTTTPLPTGTSGTTTLASGGDLTNAAGFVFLDRNASVAGLDTLYVADQTGGLVKFSFDGAAWTQRGW